MTQASPTIYKGNNSAIWLLNGKANPADSPTWITHGTFAISDFSLTLSKGTVEQELVGEIGNYSIAGALSAEGSLTGCKMYAAGLGKLLDCLINGTNFAISGNCGANSLHFFLRSCQVTGFDFTVGTADDITEGSADFTVLYAYKITNTRTGNYTVIADTSWP